MLKETGVWDLHGIGLCKAWALLLLLTEGLMGNADDVSHSSGTSHLAEAACVLEGVHRRTASSVKSDMLSCPSFGG